MVELYTRFSRAAMVRGTTMWPIMIALAILLMAPPIASAVTFEVTDTTDAPDANLGDGLCKSTLQDGPCTLRAAIQQSNALSPALPMADIKLMPGPYVLTQGTLEITRGLSLAGGTDPTKTRISGDKKFRVFDIKELARVHMFGITVEQGNAPSDSGGGLIMRRTSYLSLGNCVISENVAKGEGAGISNSGGVLDIFNCTISNNKLNVIIADGGEFTSGGGIFSKGKLTIYGSTIVGNTANRGAGIDNAGEMEIVNSTISGNFANGGGGGIRNGSRFSSEAQATIAFSTIANNVANLRTKEAGSGGGIFNFGRVTIGNTILADNIDKNFLLDRSLEPNCFNGTGFFGGGTGTIISVGGNVFGTVHKVITDTLKDNCNRTGGGLGLDKIGDPKFILEDPNRPLDDPNRPRLDPFPPLDPNRPLDGLNRPLLTKANGGPIATHALLGNSPAINPGIGGDGSTIFLCPVTDQRGFARSLNVSSDPLGNCDAGAVEFGVIAPSNVNKLMSLASLQTDISGLPPTPEGPAGTFFITATFTNKSRVPIRRPFFQVAELSDGNAILTDIPGPTGVGATKGAGGVLAPGQSITVEWAIGLQTLEPFKFSVDVFGEPVS